MRRFRLLFVTVAAVVAVPVGLLLQRAVESVALEQRTRHQAVAERIFDEMERTLSAWLAREEERPFGQYSSAYIPQGAHADVAVRSPLADPPSLPFIRGYFQVDPDGSVHTPLQLPATVTGQASPAGRAALTELERTVGPYFRAGVRTGAAPGGTAPAPQVPGTTVAVSDGRTGQRAGDRPKPSRDVSAYDALSALNKGSEQRAGRQAKAALEYALQYAPALRPAPAGQGLMGLTDDPGTDARSVDTAAAPEVREPVRLEINPMVGRILDAQALLLYRTVVREARTYRQGVLLDLDGLTAWLRAQALGMDGVGAYATVAFTNSFAPAPQSDGTSAYAYRHRFAEPFADLSADLALQPLPGVGSAAYVYALCVVVLVAGGLGLLALYRMVSVTLSYAERRSNFVAAVSHELKTPLTAIRMYGEMLRDGIVPAEAKRAEYYRHITTESERLSRLINNVLEFSRLEKGTRQMSLVTAPLGAVVSEGVALLRPHAEREGFTLDLDVDPALPSVRFERDALLQVLFNLVDNALKYARDGQPRRISIGCHAAGRTVGLTVRDHGPGVPPQHLRKLFAPFYRGESELTRRNTGTGLGLALVHGLARQMGARTVAHNVADGGFEMQVIFPIA